MGPPEPSAIPGWVGRSRLGLLAALHPAPQGLDPSEAPYTRDESEGRPWGAPSMLAGGSGILLGHGQVTACSSG